MIEANMLEAKTKLSQLVEAAERGEEVFLKRDGVAVAQIVPIPKRKLPFGFLAGKVGDTPDSLLFDMSEEAVDRRFQKRGLGAALLGDAVIRTIKAGSAAFALMVDAKNDKAVAFHQHHGFMACVSQPGALFLPVATAAKAFFDPVALAAALAG